jgi:hypothetical protein
MEKIQKFNKCQCLLWTVLLRYEKSTVHQHHLIMGHCLQFVVVYILIRKLITVQIKPK